jgi:hypothetical protein
VALDAPTALLVVAAGHAGFQLTVTTMVYPTLAATRPEDWSRVHDRHSRAITPLVVLVYGGLVLTGTWTVVAAPLDAMLLVALAAAAATILVTGAFAAPLHARLGAQGPRSELLLRLLAVDRVRLVLALLTLLWAAGAALTT